MIAINDNFKIWEVYKYATIQVCCTKNHGGDNMTWDGCGTHTPEKKGKTLKIIGNIMKPWPTDFVLSITWQSTLSLMILHSRYWALGHNKKTVLPPMDAIKNQLK